jgi:hypothetical protein
VSASAERPARVLAHLALAWGLLGLFAALAEAIVRLTPLAIAPLKSGMSPTAWCAYLAFALLNAYAEGYRGFQRGFAPRVAVRARILFREPSLLRALLAPLFLAALVSATRRRLIANWLLVFGISALIMVLRHTPQPWRGVVDAGVVVGLVWGTLSMIVELVAIARGQAPKVDAELG